MTIGEDVEGKDFSGIVRPSVMRTGINSWASVLGLRLRFFQG